MSVNNRRVRAIVHKELRDFRRNRSLIVGMAIIPVLFCVQPLVRVNDSPNWSEWRPTIQLTVLSRFQLLPFRLGRQVFARPARRTVVPGFSSTSVSART